jgi:hypothetical protein
MELSIRAGFAVRFSPLRWERGDQPCRHELAFAFEVKLAPPRIMDRIFKPPVSMTGGCIAESGWLSIHFLLDEKTTVAPVGSRKVSYGVGLRWQAVFGCQIIWNRST